MQGERLAVGDVIVFQIFLYPLFSAPFLQFVSCHCCFGPGDVLGFNFQGRVFLHPREAL